MNHIKSAFVVGGLLFTAVTAGALSLDESLRAFPSQREGYTVDELTERFASPGIHDIEGVWGMTADDSLFAVTRSEAGGLMYELRVVEAADRRVVPGTLFGVAAPTAKPGYYDCRIYTGFDGKNMTAPKRFTLHITDVGTLVITQVTDKYTVNFSHLLPYMARVTIKHVNDRDKGLDGAVRLLPEDKAFTTGPRVL